MAARLSSTRPSLLLRAASRTDSRVDSLGVTRCVTMHDMVRLGSCVRPAGESPVRVSAGAPGSRPRLEGEIPMVERGVESLFGGSERAGCDCSLVTFTIGEPSRSCHGEGHVRQSWFRIGCGGSLRGRGSCTRARSDRGTRETRLSSLVSKDRLYKPDGEVERRAAGVRGGRSSGDRRQAKGARSEGPLL